MTPKRKRARKSTPVQRLARNPTARVYSQATPTNLNDAIALEGAPRPSVLVSSRRDGAGKRTYAQTGKVSLKSRVLSLSDLTSLVAPPFKLKLLNYGYNMYGRAADNSKTEVSGNLRNIIAPAGKQYWLETVALPAIDLNNNGTICDVERLIYKAHYNINNLSFNQGPTSTPLTTTGTDGGTRNERQFQYLGGSQTHTFINSGNTTCHAEFWTLTPRHPMIGYTSAGVMRSVAADVLADILANKPRANDIFPQPQDLAYDATDDIAVRIADDLSITNAKYKITSPLKVIIEPGETFTFTINLPPFKCTNTEWNYLIHPTSADHNLAHFIPGFTRLLCARFYGEPAHDAQAIGTAYTKIVSAPISLMHKQTEYHHCRALPTQQTKNVTICDKLDTYDTPTYSVEVTGNPHGSTEQTQTADA